MALRSWGGSREGVKVSVLRNWGGGGEGGTNRWRTGDVGGWDQALRYPNSRCMPQPSVKTRTPHSTDRGRPREPRGLVGSDMLVPGEGNGNLLQRSCLENPMDRGAWWAIVHGVAQSGTQLSHLAAAAAPRCWLISSNDRPTLTQDAGDKGFYGHVRWALPLLPKLSVKPKTTFKNKVHYTGYRVGILWITMLHNWNVCNIVLTISQ